MGSINISAGATLAGSGSASGLYGSGTVAPGSAAPGILSATHFDGEDHLGTDFVFAQTGSPIYESPFASGNDVLRLTNAEPFSRDLDANNTIRIFLDVESLSSGQTFRGGFFTEVLAPFDERIQNAAFNFYLRDEEGAYTHRGETYRRYQGPLHGFIRTVADGTGQVMEVTWGRIQSFEAWQEIHFPDPADRDNTEIAGPYGDANGHGMKNLMKYALGLGPREAPTSDHLQTKIDESGRLLLRFARNPIESDIAYIVEGSLDLRIWDVFFDSRTEGETNNSGIHHQVLVPPEPDSEARSRFVRLRVVVLE